MTEMQYKYIKIINNGGLRKIIFNNPKKKNSINFTTYEELTDALKNADTDDSVNIVAITGEGEFYSSGNDISNFLSSSDLEETMKTSRKMLIDLIRAFYSLKKVLICVINGPCIGIAATTALLSDVVYASDTAYFYTPFSNLGLCAEGCASFTFPRILGKSKASEMLLLNHKLSADEAYRFNLVAEVFPKKDFDTVLWPKIQKFAELPRESLKVTKKLMKQFDLNDLETACEQEMDELFKRFLSDDFTSAVMQFMNRKSKL